MKCTVEIGGKSIPLEWRGGTAIQYKYVFKRDPIADVMSLIGVVDFAKSEIKTEDVANFDSEIIYRIFWTAARTADKEVNEDFYEFLDEFDSIPVVDLLEQGLLEMLITSMISTKEPKKYKAPAQKTK